MKSPKPIQIIKKEKHLFYLKLDQLEPVLNSNELKDRHVVIVSIAGDLRKGKSFLLNFFLKYLNAQVKKRSNSISLLSNLNVICVFNFKSIKNMMYPIGLVNAKKTMKWLDSIFVADKKQTPKVFGCGQKYLRMIVMMVKKLL